MTLHYNIPSRKFVRQQKLETRLVKVVYTLTVVISVLLMHYFGLNYHIS